MRYKQESLRER